MGQNRPRVFTKNLEDVAVLPLDDLPLTPPVDYQPVAPESYRDEMPVLGSKTEVIVENLVPITIQLSQDLYNQYTKLAIAQELTLEEVLQHRLDACKNHNSLRGLWFTDSERGQLENLIQKWPLESAAQALSLLAKAATVTFDEVAITLTPAQKRALSFAMFGGRTPKTFFESMVRKELRV